MEEVEEYRSLVTAADLVSNRVRIRESDLMIRSGCDLSRPAREALTRYRRDIEEYLFCHPEWGKSLFPVSCGENAPEIVSEMSQAAAACEVGPMATVAGALAWFVGEELSTLAGGEVIIENGGDLYFNSRRDRTILVRPGKEYDFPNNIGIRIPGRLGPTGAATSSGTGGRSLSLGKVSAAVVVAADSIVADAAATALGNRVRSPERAAIEAAVKAIAAIPAVIGCLVICGNLLAARGGIELVDLGDLASGRESLPSGGGGRRG